MDKRFWAVIVVIILIFGGVYWATNHKSGAPTSNSSQPSNNVEGEGKSGVKLVEYGDFQCPACGEYYQAVKDTAAKYNTQITFQFRNFPLTSLHPNAFAGARAAEAAALQGKFWQMHDALYTQNVAYYSSNEELSSTWITPSDPLNNFVALAQQLGLNIAKFKSDYASDKVNNTIDADEAAGNKLNIDATPTFFLDGKKVQPNPTDSSFDSLINAEIAAKNKK